MSPDLVVDRQLERLLKRIHELELPGYGDDEITFMLETVRIVMPQVIYEWGTNRGSSARIFYEITSRTHIKPRPIIHTIDVPDELAAVTRDHAGHFTGMHVENIARVKCHRGDGLTTALALFAEDRRWRQKPLFYVDGDHAPGPVRNELFTIAEREPAAAILVHDTNHPDSTGPTGPREAVEALAAAEPRYEMAVLRSQAGMVRLVPR